MPAAPASFLDPAMLARISDLALLARTVVDGFMHGQHRSMRKGASMDFAEHRSYQPGDDLRRIDWNVFARLERPFIKLLEEEEDLAVHVLLDASTSMDWPHGDTLADNKFTFARRVVAGLAHISLGSGDRLTVNALRGGSSIGATWGPYRGRGRTLDLIRFLSGVQASGSTDLNAALRDYAVRTSRAGLCLIVSDLLSPGGYQDGLAALQGRGHEIALIHDEVNPPMAGDLRLVDSETGVAQDVTVDGALRDQYVRRLLAWREEISTYAARRGIHYATVETSTPWEALILYELRRMGLVH